MKVEKISLKNFKKLKEIKEIFRFSERLYIFKKSENFRQNPRNPGRFLPKTRAKSGQNLSFC